VKELPKIFANKINENLNNTQEIFYGKDRSAKKEYDSKSIIKKINDIFASKNHVYKSKVKITFNDKIVEKVIIGKNNNTLITYEGELINVSDILDVEKI